MKSPYKLRPHIFAQTLYSIYRLRPVGRVRLAPTWQQSRRPHGPAPWGRSPRTRLVAAHGPWRDELCILVKETVPQTFYSRFFTKQLLLLVIIDMPRKIVIFKKIFVKLFVFVDVFSVTKHGADTKTNNNKICQDSPCIYQKRVVLDI